VSILKQGIRLSTFPDRIRSQDGARASYPYHPPHASNCSKALWTAVAYFDVWFPALASSIKLASRFQGSNFEDVAVRDKFFDSYERELLSTAESNQ